MLTKKMRHGRILEIIRRHAVYSQKELIDALRKRGFKVTQTTLSRDIRELGLVKGIHGYQIEEGSESASSEENLRRVLREFLLEINASGKLIVLKTDPGCAHTVAVAIDRVGWDEILGTIAGDDTILAVVSQNHQTSAAVKHIRASVGWD